MKLLKKIIISVLILLGIAGGVIGARFTYYYITHDQVVSPQKYKESLILKNKVYEKDLVQKESNVLTAMGKWNYFKMELNCNTDKYVMAYRFDDYDYKKCTDKESLEYSSNLNYSTDKLDRLIDDDNAFNYYISVGDYESNKIKANTPDEVFTYLINNMDKIKSLYSEVQSGKLRKRDAFLSAQITCDFVKASYAKENNKQFDNCKSFEVFKYYKTERYLTILRKMANI